MNHILYFVFKSIEGLGILLMFVGGCSMDSNQTFLPFILAIAGVGITYIGAKLEDYFEWWSEKNGKKSL